MKNSVQDAVLAIRNLDLEPLKMKLMLPSPEGNGWSQQATDVAEEWYRRFLILHVKYPNECHVPNEPIDEFWHKHILDTRKYAKDCDDVFGEFLHHFPYFGLRGDADKRDAAFEQTNLYYRIEFGEDCTTMFSDDGSVLVGMKCNHSGSGTGCGQGCGSK